jgi:hypothetical protein
VMAELKAKEGEISEVMVSIKNGHEGFLNV